MDNTHRALDIAFQNGFLDIQIDNHNYPQEMLKSVDKNIMRSVMNAIMVWWAVQKRQNPNFPITGIIFRRFMKSLVLGKP